MSAQEISEAIGRLKDYEPGPQYDALVDLIDWELRAQLALGRLGNIEPSPAQIKRLAEMIAVTLDIHLDVRPRPPTVEP